MIFFIGLKLYKAVRLAYGKASTLLLSSYFFNGSVLFCINFRRSMYKSFGFYSKSFAYFASFTSPCSKMNSLSEADPCL